MKGDYSWSHSAKEYIKLYEALFHEREVQPAAEETVNPVVVDID